MADVKISELNALASATVDVAADVFAVVDTSATATRKISVENVLAPIVINKAANTITTLGTVSGATSITSTAFVGPLNGIIGGTTPAAGTFTTLTASGNVGIGASSPDAKLEVLWGAAAGSDATILLGADSGASTATDNTQKQSLIAHRKYDNDEEHFTMFYGEGGDGENRIAIGGGLGTYTAATNIRFHTAANDNTAAGTERMRIIADGKVGIGTSSPIAGLHIAKQASAHTLALGAVTGTDDNTLLALHCPDSAIRSIGFYDGSTQKAWIAYEQRSSKDELQINAQVGQMLIQTGGTTALTLDTSQNATFAGNIVMGNNSGHSELYMLCADSSASTIHFQDAGGTTRSKIRCDTQSGTHSHGDITFFTGGETQVLNLSRDQVADFAGPLTLASSASGWAQLIKSTNADPYVTKWVMDEHPNNETNMFLQCDGDGDDNKFKIWSNGELWQETGGSTINSDRKLKDNIVDASSKLDDINKLKVRNFNYKKTPDIKRIGFIAQEVEEIFPSLVKEHPHTTEIKDDEGNVVKPSEWSKNIQQVAFIPMLIKAVQELSAKVEVLENA